MSTVLMTTDTVGGVWAYSLELAAALAAREVRVHLATMGPAPDPDQREAARGHGVAGLHQSGYALEWMPQPWADVDAAGEWLLDLAGELHPDVVHLNGYAHAALPWPAPTVVVGHSCVLSWWWAVHGEPAPPEWADYRRRVRAGLHAAGAVVAPTRAMLAELERWYGLGGGVVIPNGRRGDWVREVPKQPLVAAAGRAWDEAKNLQVLDRVAASLPAPVVVAGGREHPATGAAAGGTGASWLGRRPFDEVASLLLRASVFCAPARYEPFGLAPLEAGLAGCALVLADLPSLREVWGGAAVYVDPDDADALRAVLARLLEAPALAAAAGARARERAHRYRPELMAARYHRLYQRLAQQQGRRSA